MQMCSLGFSEGTMSDELPAKVFIPFQSKNGIAVLFYHLKRFGITQSYNVKVHRFIDEMQAFA